MLLLCGRNGSCESRGLQKSVRYACGKQSRFSNRQRWHLSGPYAKQCMLFMVIPLSIISMPDAAITSTTGTPHDRTVRCAACSWRHYISGLHRPCSVSAWLSAAWPRTAPCRTRRTSMQCCICEVLLESIGDTQMHQCHPRTSVQQYKQPLHCVGKSCTAIEHMLLLLRLPLQAQAHYAATSIKIPQHTLAASRAST